MNAIGWTGGQYSLFRAGFGVYLFQHFCGALPRDLASPEMVPVVIAIICSVFFMVGSGDRAAALVLGASGILLYLLWCPAAPLFLHCFVPGAPYGSLAASGRVDPRGGWYMPRQLWLAAWCALAGIYLGILIAFVLKEPVDAIALGLLALHVFTFDPQWIRPLRASGPERLFYDGNCGLCHRAVRFVLAENRCANAFRFAPLTSETFLREIPEAKRATLPDSIVVLTAERDVLTRSAGVLHIGKRLGGFWRVAATIAGWLPPALLDGIYDAIARIRLRLFRQPEDACPVAPPEMRRHFDN